jgi:hypothetical protein
MKHDSYPPDLRMTTLLVVGLAIASGGCSSSYTVSSTGKPNAEYSYREMNEELKGRDVKIKLKDGRDISATEAKISDDSVSWVDRRTDEASKVSVREINGIVTKSHSIGALEGIGFGLVGGGGLGAIVGQVAVGNDGAWGTGAGAAIGFILGGGAGVIFGFPTGLRIGHSYNYEFRTTVQSDSLQNGK